MQCARGACAVYFRNRGAPTYRKHASACSPAPAALTILKLGKDVFLLSASST